MSLPKHEQVRIDLGQLKQTAIAGNLLEVGLSSFYRPGKVVVYYRTKMKSGIRYYAIVNDDESLVEQLTDILMVSYQAQGVTVH